MSEAEYGTAAQYQLPALSLSTAFLQEVLRDHDFPGTEEVQCAVSIAIPSIPFAPKQAMVRLPPELGSEMPDPYG